MEPVTHFLTGACIGRTGFNRKTAYATLAATLAAEAPDLDVLWGLDGPIAGFAHHRGITHTLIAAPAVAAIITGFVWFLDRVWFSRTASRKNLYLNPQPIRWLWVFLAALVAAFSHVLLDWTNNYGVRPFFPFNDRWYAGDLVFIAEPVLWALLVGALVLPALFGLTDREVGARRTRFRGRGLAIAALVGMVALWCWRWAEHAQGTVIVAAAQVTPTPARRIALEPYPLNPWRWHALLETDTTWQVAEVDTRTHAVESDVRINSLAKPVYTPTLAAARNSPLGRVYLDWSSWPVVRDVGPFPTPGFPPPNLPASREWSNVEFSDMRFAYAFLNTGMGSSSEQTLDHTLSNSGLTGWVYILDGRDVGSEFINGREQK